MKLLLSPQVEVDLESIFDYTVRLHGLLQAERYQDDLFHAMQTIVSFPKMGTKYNFSSIPYRKFPVRKHLIFYRIEQDSLIIIRVLHEGMDLAGSIA